MKILKHYVDFINEELKILKGPTTKETEEVFNDMSPVDALIWSIEGYLPEYIKRAIERGADINTKEEDKNGDGWTALMVASYRGNLELVKYLIEHGADINIKDNYGETALMHATGVDEIDVIKYLIENGADIEDENYKEFNAYDLASSKVKAYFTKVLKQRNSE